MVANDVCHLHHLDLAKCQSLQKSLLPGVTNVSENPLKMQGKIHGKSSGCPCNFGTCQVPTDEYLGPRVL